MALLTKACASVDQEAEYRCSIQIVYFRASVPTLKIHIKVKSLSVATSTKRLVTKSSIPISISSRTSTSSHHANPSGYTVCKHGGPQLRVRTHQLGAFAFCPVSYLTHDLPCTPSDPRRIAAVFESAYRLLLPRSATTRYLQPHSGQPLVLPPLSCQPDGAFPTTS